MKICYFGIYDPGYSRNRVLLKGFKANGIKVVECRSVRSGIIKYLDLLLQYLKIKKDFDFLFVAFPGQTVMVLARFLTRKKIIFDAFTSFYDSAVNDRKTIKRKSFGARKLWWLDKISCCMANLIITDTNENIKYFSETFHVPKENFIRVFVGSDYDSIGSAKGKKERDYFLVHFHGTNIPLQGVEYIMGAAKLLEGENIKFNMIGTKIKNQHQDQDRKNINFIDNVPYENLGEYISGADVSLGIFGATDKAQRVIPNKVYEALAAGTAVITGDTPATRELLTDGVNAIFCRMADPEDLADKILRLRDDLFLRNLVAKKGYELFINKLTHNIIVKNFIVTLKNNGW